MTSPIEDTIIKAGEEQKLQEEKEAAPVSKIDPKDMFIRGTIELLCSDRAFYYKRGERFYLDMAVFKGSGLLGLESMELTSFVLRLAKKTGNIMLRTADVELIKDHVRLHAMENAAPLATDNRAAMRGKEMLFNTGWRGSDLIAIKSTGDWEVRQVLEHIFEPLPSYMAMAKPVPTPATAFPELLKAGIGDFADRHCLIAASCGTMMLPAFFPHPFLTFTGDQARGKSTTMKLLLQLIDPYEGGELMSVGEDSRDLISMCRDRHCIALDNVSSLPFDEDLLSKMYSGGIFMARKMTTNSELSTAHIPMMRVMLNGIGPAFSRSDLMSRCIFIEHPILTTGVGGEDFLSLTEVQGRWQAKLPELLGSLLSAVSEGWKLFQDRGGLAGKTSKCRYVEYALIGECIAEAMGFKPGEFTNQVNGTADSAKTNAIEADDCAQLVIDWLNGARGTSQHAFGGWEDTIPRDPTAGPVIKPGQTQVIISSTDLFTEIRDLAASRKYSVFTLKWLASVKAFSTAITRSSRNIKNGGWDAHQIPGGERKRNWNFLKQGTLPL